MITVNLFDDFVDQVRQKFNLDDSFDSFDVIKIYAWYDLRRLPIRKWKVYYSRELKQNNFYLTHRQFVDKIKEKAEKGEDLSPHASVLITKISAKDEMLADWGIYHLHIGHGTKPARIQGFVNRTKELLFVMPNRNNLYFIDILDHNSWTNFRLIEVIDNNWPFLLEPFKLKNVISLAYEPTEEEVYKMRKNQLNATFRVGNSFFIGPGGGIATDGSSVRAVQMAQGLQQLLTDFSKQLEKNENHIRKKIEEALRKTVEDIHLELHEYDPKTGRGKIIEKNSQTILSFSFPDGAIKIESIPQT